MTKPEHDKLREHIAQGINHGLNNLEIYGLINDHGIITPADLIGVIRDLITEKPSDFDDTQEIIVLTPVDSLQKS